MAYEASVLYAAELPGEAFHDDYKKHKDIFRKILSSDRKLERGLRKYFKELADRMDAMINWSAYNRELIKATSVASMITSQWKGEHLLLKVLITDSLKDAIIAGGELTELDTKIDIGWSGSNKPAIDFLNKYSLKLAGQLSDTTVERIKAQLNASLADGRNQAEAIAKIAEIVDDPARAEMIARTESIRAFSEGRLAVAEEVGADRKQWSATSGACAICEPLDNEVTELDGDFDGYDAPPAHPNAVLEGTTFVSYGKLEEMVGADYEGPAVLIRTSEDHNITIGMNHPVFTQRGLVKASQLTKSDYLVYDTRFNTSSSQIDFKQIPLVENAFKSLLSGGSKVVITTPAHDLHGDIVFCKGEIQVIKPTDSLLPILNSSGIEQFRENGFMGTNIKSVLLSGDSSSCFSLNAINLTPSSIMSSTLSSYQFVHIQSIDYVKVKCKAFDATTESGLYNSNGFVVSNCRCLIRILLPNVKPFD